MDMGLLTPARPLHSGLRWIPYAIDVWCPVARSSAVRAGKIVSTRLLGAPIALFRGTDGQIHAVQDRCPHRGVELSLGRVCGSRIQCAYHGWMVDGSGDAVGANGKQVAAHAARTGSFVTAEANGLVWIFIGETPRTGTPSFAPPAFAPLNDSPSIDLLIDLPVAAHWSLVLDNGVDLFHQHLHRDVPFFFRIESLEGYETQGETFVVRYRALISDESGRRRPALITIAVDRNIVALRFGDSLIIYGVPVPRSVDGRELTMWWMVRAAAPFTRRLLIRLLLPLIRRQVVRGFRQDCDVLASEQRAFDAGFRDQLESNPAIFALHQHIEQRVLKEAVTRGWEVPAGARQAAPLNLDRRRVLEQAQRGEIAVIARSDGVPAIVAPDRLAHVLPLTETFAAYVYGHFCLLA